MAGKTVRARTAAILAVGTMALLLGVPSLSAASLLDQATEPQEGEVAHAVCGKYAGLGPCEERLVTKDPSVWKPLALYAVAEGLDEISTLHVMARGGHEVNPLMRGTPAVITAKKVVLVAALTYFDRRAQQSGHVKVRRIAYIAGRALLTAWNISAAAHSGK